MKNYNEAKPILLRTLALSVSAILGTVIAFIIFSGVEALINGKDLSLFGAVWNPNAGHFGILTMIQSSILLSISALSIGWCLSLGCCCVLNGLATDKIAKCLMEILMLMTAIPTVVYGFAAVFLLVPLIRDALGGTGFCWLTASLILALQGVPTMTFVMNSAFHTISSETKLTAAALGMTQLQHLSRIVIPLASKSMLSAGILGLGRAVGDALIPTMLAGNAIRFAKTPIDSMRTLTAHISLVLSSDIGGGEHLSLLLAGALLLTFCAFVSVISRRLTRRHF